MPGQYRHANARVKDSSTTCVVDLVGPFVSVAAATERAVYFSEFCHGNKSQQTAHPPIVSSIWLDGISLC